MYVDIDGHHRIHLMDMTREEADTLARMVEGAGLLHRQVFWRVREQLKQSVSAIDICESLAKGG